MIKDADGNEAEFFSADEVTAKAAEQAKEIADARVAEETEKLQTAHESALSEKDEALAEVQSKLEKAEAKELNFKALRDKAGGKVAEPTEDEKKNTEELKALKETVAEIQKQPFETAKTAFLKNNIGEDKDLGEKHDYFFKKLSAGAKTVEEYNQALEGAFALATGGARQPNTTGSMTRTSVNDNFSGGGAKTETQDSQNFGALLGITPEDKKTFAPAVATGVVPLFQQTPPKEKA